MKQAQPHLIFLHGFNSSPQAHKAQLLRQALQAQGFEDSFSAPDLHVPPLDALATLEEEIARYADRQISLVGSSYGGYFAIYLSEKYNLKTILINPVIHLYDLVAAYIGTHKNPATGRLLTIIPEHADDVKTLRIETLSQPDNFLVLLQKDDAIIPYHTAQQYFSHSTQIIKEGGGHEFIGFEDICTEVLAFAGFN